MKDTNRQIHQDKTQTKKLPQLQPLNLEQLQNVTGTGTGRGLKLKETYGALVVI